MHLARISLALRTLVLLLCLIPAARGENSLQWRAALYGYSADDTLSSARVVGIGGELNLERDIGQSLHAHFLGGAMLETGSASSLFTDELQPLSRFSLVEADLQWTIFAPFSVAAGAIDQSYLRSPLLIAGSTFPAALATLRLGSGSWVADMKAQAAIPTSQRLATKSAGKEPTPLLYNQTAVAGWQDGGDDFVLLRATHFDFRNLTHGMAQDSRFYGNTVAGVAAASTLTYQFEGWELGADGSLPLGTPDLHGLLGGSFVHNGLGPGGANTGRYAYAGVNWQAGATKARLVGEWYESQADSAPAFYTSREFGHNNRRGPGASLRLKLPEPGLEIEFHARSTHLIHPVPFQKDNFRFFELLIGIPYANF